MAMRSDVKRSTLAAQALGGSDPSTGAIVPPLVASAPYERAPDGTYPGGHTYTRDQNPTYDRCEALLARLEDGHEALLFSSGMAAATTVFRDAGAGRPRRRPGGDCTGPSGAGCRRARRTAGSRSTWFPTATSTRLRRALRPGATRMVWVETPSNPTCAITDIAATAEIAHAAGARVVADGTVATPVLCRPLRLGADLVMHSATKQLNGHSDVLAGALVTARDDGVWEQIRHERANRGAVLGPFEAWLLLRGMRTLFLRVSRSAENAQRVAEALARHPDVTAGAVCRVCRTIPATSSPAVRCRAATGRSSPSAWEDAAASAKQVIGALRLFRNATSLGGVESLVEHRAPVEGPGTPVPPDLVRLSIGIEDAGDLIADLEQALARAGC